MSRTMRWVKDERGEPYPVYTDEEAHRLARAAWGIHFLLPHPDDVKDPAHATSLRNFNRALSGDPPLAAESESTSPEEK